MENKCIFFDANNREKKCLLKISILKLEPFKALKKYVKCNCLRKLPLKKVNLNVLAFLKVQIKASTFGKIFRGFYLSSH